MNPSAKDRYDQAPAASRWPHRSAMLLLCATLMLICVGGLVTTLDAGMAFADYPTSDGWNMFAYPWFRAAGKKFIEHGHRLFGAVVGLITIATCLSLWLCDRRRWLGWLGVAALALVIFQGLLGGMRVLADNIQLAKLHGCVAPLFFAIVVAIAVSTSRWWLERKPISSAASAKLQRLALFATGLAYLQLVLGAQLRHVSPQASGDALRVALVFHLLVAFALLIHAILLLFAARRNVRGEVALIRPAKLLLGLILVQVLLGGGTWVLKYGWPAEFFQQFPIAAGWTNTAGGVAESIVVTGHMALGSLILGTALLATLRMMHGTRTIAASMPGHVDVMGVAL